MATLLAILKITSSWVCHLAGLVDVSEEVINVLKENAIQRNTKHALIKDWSVTFRK